MKYSTDIKDYYRRAWGLGDRVPFKHGGTWADWKVNYEDQMTFEEYLQDDTIVKKLHALDRKAKGGKVAQPRRKYLAGAFGMAAPTLAYPAMVGVAKLLGITTAGLGAKELSNVVTQKIKENPEVLETPQAKGIMLAFGLTPGGLVFGPDADAIEKEKEKIKESLKPGKTYPPDPFPIHTGHPRPEIKKEEPPVSGGKIDIPLTTGGSEIPETKLEDLIFTIGTTKDKEVKKLKVKEILEQEPDISQREIAKRLKILPSSVNLYIKELQKETPISKEEIKETFDKQKILYDQKKMKESAATTNKEFAQKVADFVDLNHNGRLEPAVKEILGKDATQNEINNLRARINSLWANRGIERDVRTGNIAPVSGLDIPEGDTTWSQTTTNISKDKSYIKNKVKPLIKEGKIDKGNYYSLRALEQIFGIQHKGTDLQKKSARNNMNWILNKEWKAGTLRRKKDGKYPSFHLGDVRKILENKYGEGAKKIAGVVKQGTPEKYAKSIAFDKEVQN